MRTGKKWTMNKKNEHYNSNTAKKTAGLQSCWYCFQKHYRAAFVPSPNFSNEGQKHEHCGNPN
jgi:hypothetical protein